MLKNKELKFESKLIPLILSGKKTSTWRLFDDKNLQVADILTLVNKDTGEKFANAEIKSVKEKKLVEIVETDFKGHEKFEDKEEMFETYKQYYGNEVTWNSTVKMIKFKIL